jgi:hypothetical protein
MMVSAPAIADRAAYVELAKRGWSYQLRTTMVGRDLSIPVHINGGDLAGASLCMVGERPHESSLKVINSFRALVLRTYGKPMPMRYAGPDASVCGSGRTVILRLYSGFPPNSALSADLRWMDAVYQLGLPGRRVFAATSPAMAQTFFGRRGQGVHIMVKQPALTPRDVLEATFYKSILIEELFQSFTFGMDILIFNRGEQFLSKLQETPMNLQRLPWDSQAFMRALVRSNPSGLCLFDVFMMHAVGEAPVDQTIDAAFIDYIDANYDDLLARTKATMTDPAVDAIVTPECRHVAG